MTELAVLDVMRAEVAVGDDEVAWRGHAPMG